MTPVRCVSTPALPGPVAPPPYSPPTPIYRPDPSPSPVPSPVSANVTPSPGQCSGGSVIINPQCPRAGASVFKHQSALTLPKGSNVDRNEPKLWEKIQTELPKELSRFCKEIMENIGNYSQLVDFAIKYDVPLTWIDRAREDYPNDSQPVINQVFYEWWDRSHLNLARKLRTIQAAFGYMGKPAIFNRIMYTCPDVKMLIDHSVLTRMPSLTCGKDGKTGAAKPHPLESVWVLAQEKSDGQLKGILSEVQKMVQKGHPNYALAAEHISHYRDMKLVTFAVDQQTHSLIITFPVFIQDFRRPPLSLFEIETVPVPIPDENFKADSYTQVQIEKPYIAVGTEYYIELRMTEMIMCRSIRFTYYCEELFVVKHKNAHGCSSAIFYDMGAKRVTEACEFKYMYNATVAPTILDGGKELLLANFHGPRSLKCDTKDGRLAKPMPEHTYAVVNREFLCDCQLDLEYASILKQISACGEKTHYDLTLRFTVNLAFWQMLKQYKPKLAKIVMPNMNRIEQTFPVKLFENVKGPLQIPTALTDIVKRLDDEGKKSKQTETKNTPIFSRYESNIMTIVSGGLASICAIVILIILVKQTRLQSLVSSLRLVSLIPPAKALYFTEMPKATNVPYFLAKNVPNEKVVCSHPLLTAVGSAIAIGGALYAAYQVFRSLSWYRGYRNSRCCTMYFFLYHDDFYTPLKIKSLSGHIHMYKMENKLMPGQLTLQRNYLWDTVTIDWENVQILKHDEPVAMPVTVTVLLSHKIKTRNILNTEYEIQVTLKKGNDWINITQWTAKKHSHVKAMCDVLENK